MLLPGRWYVTVMLIPTLPTIPPVLVMLRWSWRGMLSCNIIGKKESSLTLSSLLKWQGNKLLILLRHWYWLELIILCNHQNSKFHKWYNIVVVLTKNGFQACIILSNIGFLIHRKSHKNLSTLAFLISTVVTYRKLCILAFSAWILCTASFQVFVIHISKYISGAANVNFRKISVRKTIWDLEFSEHLL